MARNRSRDSASRLAVFTTPTSSRKFVLTPIFFSPYLFIADSYRSHVCFATSSQERMVPDESFPGEKAAGSSRTRDSLDSNFPGLTGGSTGWARPLSTNSERADESVTIVGTPRLIASAATSPKHSRSEGRTTTLHEL